MSISNDELQQLLLATFADEVKEQLQTISERLLALEEADGDERGPLVEEIFREVHSLKGAARAVNLDGVEAAAHRFESLFSAIQKGELETDAEVFHLAYKGLDALSALVEEGLAERPKRDETVRVATSKLDALMAHVGKLDATRAGAEDRLAELGVMFDAMVEIEEGWSKTGPARLDESIRTVRNGLGELRRKLEADSLRVAQVTTSLEEDVRRMRVLPVSTIFDAFPRMVRDLARDLSKEVKLTIEGGETEVDKQVLEQLRAPLTHMVRNSVDHGVERPDAREAAGKKREGTVVLSAARRAASIVIEVVDDGAGIDVDKVKAKAVEKGVITADNAQVMSGPEALWLIFRPGFSTRHAVTELSGRGVGMDVVQEHIKRLCGTIDVESTPGEGTKFTLSVPL